MALDPTISLGVKSFAPSPTMMQDYALNNMKMAQIGQGIQQSQQEIEASKQAQATSAASEQNLIAQKPGLEAQSASSQAKLVGDQQDAKAIQYGNTIAPKYTTETTNADGTISKHFDNLAWANDMAQNGYIKQAGAAAKNWADGVSANADAIKKLQDNTGELAAAQLKLAGPILNAAAKEPDPVKRAILLDNGLAGAEGSYPQLFPKGSTTNIEQLFNRAKVDPTTAASFAMTPKDWITLNNETKNVETNRINAVSGQINAQTSALSQKIGVVGAVTAANTDAALYDNGVAAVQNLRDPKTGTLPENVAGLVGEKLQLAISKDPSLAGLNGAIQKAAADGQIIDYSGGFSGVQQQLRLLAQIKKDSAANLTSTQAGGPVSATGNRALPTGSPAAPTAGTTQPVDAKFKAGAIVDGLPVYSAVQAKTMPKGTKFYGTDGQMHYVK